MRSVVYIYKAKKELNGSKFRTIWGKVCRRTATTACALQVQEELAAVLDLRACPRDALPEPHLERAASPFFEPFVLVAA